MQSSSWGQTRLPYETSSLTQPNGWIGIRPPPRWMSSAGEVLRVCWPKAEQMKDANQSKPQTRWSGVFTALSANQSSYKVASGWRLTKAVILSFGFGNQ